MSAPATSVEARARLSLGRSDRRIHETVAAALAARGASGVLGDVGCGGGDLWPLVRTNFQRCVGLDAVRYPALPPEVEFRAVDFDSGELPLADASVDAAVAIEVVEHLENPRAFARELSRIVKPGGWVVVTTPNQLSALSLLTLALKGRFSAFQDTEYPAHRTALLEVDLRRILHECGLRDVDIAFTCHGRVPLSAAHYPRAVSQLAPRRFSDNIVAIGRR